MDCEKTSTITKCLKDLDKLIFLPNIYFKMVIFRLLNLNVFEDPFVKRHKNDTSKLKKKDELLPVF